MIKKFKEFMSKDNNPVDETVEQTDASEANTAETTESVDDTSNAETEEEVQAEPESEVDILKAQVAEQKDKFLRLFAEFDNFKKRAVKEKIDMLSTASRETITAMLPVLDDFDRAKKNADDENSEEPFSEGVNLVYNKLYNVLKQKGLQEMETTGSDFDPEKHEAITEIPNEEMKGKVVDTIEKGYLLNDKIIRHAKVVVGK